MAATATKAGTDILKRFQAIFGPEGFLNKNNVERREAIDLLKLATISGVDLLFLGEPGVGKTWVIELLTNHCFAPGELALFTHLLAKDQSSDEVLGPKSLTALKEDRIARMTTGYLPEAHYAYLDEVFKASPAMLNPLLDVMANRVLKVGGATLDCSQLITILMSSNELPEREDLMAMRDRIGITYVVEPVKTPEGRRAVTDIQLGFQSGGLDTSELEPLTLADIETIRAQVREVKVPDAIRDMMGEAQQKWLEAGHPPSQRRIGQMWKVIKASAWAAGRDTVNADDLIPCQHMAFNQLDDAKTAREVVLQFASAFTRKAERLRQSLEPVLRSMDDLRTKLASTQDEGDKQDLYTSGMSLLRELRKLGGEAKSQIAEGEKQGQDVTTTEAILDEITRANEWATEALMGEL